MRPARIVGESVSNEMSKKGKSLAIWEFGWFRIINSDKLTVQYSIR